MKLSEDKPSIETSGNLEEQFFSIQDQGMIFDILRNKMYSDPILAICREISCNARDAHTEVGKKQEPIEITLPNSLEPFYKIKDCGPGISPDRMSNIFIKYTASTKRQDNLQTGGFGLGAKTPFSYSDTFTITTVFDKIKYNYACFIDETKVGKLVLMGSEPIDEVNSTEISIPIKPTDFNKFIVATEQSTRHWEIKPIIKGASINWTEYVSTLSGSGWKVAITKFQSNDRYINNGYYFTQETKYDRGVKIIVDGIEYHVSMESLKKFTNTQIIDACKGYLFLYFDIGELTLSANRESVYVDLKTENKIIGRLELVSREIVKSVNDKIAAHSTYLEANKYFTNELQSTFNSLNFLGNLNWNGTKLYGPSFSVNYLTPITEFYKHTYRARGTRIDKIKFKSRKTNTISLNDLTAIFYDDLKIKEITYKHVKQAFEEGFEVVQVINHVTNQTYASLDQTFSLTGVGCKQLSTITNDTSVANKIISANKLLVFRVYSGQYSPRFEQVACSEIEDDKNKTKVLCFFDRDKNTYGKQYKHIYLKNNTVVYGDKIAGIFNMFEGVSFYAIAKDTKEDRIKKEFSGFVSLDDFVESKITKSNLDLVGIKAALNINHYLNYDESKLNALLPLISKMSPFAKLIKSHKSINELKEKKNLLRLYESLNTEITDKEIKKWWDSNPDLNFKDIQSKCDKTYPLLIQSRLYNVTIDHIAQYINFIDSLI